MRATPVSPDLKEISVGWRETLAASAGLTLVVAVALNEQLRDFYRVPDLGEPLSTATAAIRRRHTPDWPKRPPGFRSEIPFRTCNSTASLTSRYSARSGTMNRAP